MKLLLSLALLAFVPRSSAADLTGTVVETMDSSGYTYLLLKTPAGDQKWAAVTKAKVKKGSKATVTGAMEMKDFESPSLKRKFATIAFGTLAESAPAGHGAHGGAAKGDPMAGMPPHGSRAEVKGPIKVAKPAGTDARTIGEVYAQKKALKGKEVVVAGKVVKYNAGILDRNWAHLRDGSGSAKDGSDDITVLLKDETELGKTITVRGTVTLDKDLGGMYKFPVALEDAVLVK